ncbi:hypothetical protein PCCS19_38700 [Paenibacillus sp. CCS19]|nr:hypothetical protein PCCS19_38700 [Paenibacillus cellulosilyticus]
MQLLPYMELKLTEEYSKVLSILGSPDVYPYFVDVIEKKRANGFRGFTLWITLRVHPTVGPHISVGEDQFTYQISPEGVRLFHYRHELLRIRGR